MPSRSIDVGSPYHWNGLHNGDQQQLGKVDKPLAKPSFEKPPVRRMDKGNAFP